MRENKIATAESEVLVLLLRIEQHLRRHRMTPTGFGRAAVNDPNLVEQLRRGREIRSATALRITNYLDRKDAEK